ncbi:OprD family outer membrane porin [Commensalibacter oyaizuii]|uniref:OprD family outer membrane porin n=1 Tax=Commensalibacter oyaizuii TaxID=3043873 RepID=A0ABT6Q5R2_9PROT|nr:OprD family outer membrane porin [Commensalibacter sp. TBRC 16381]MDI2091799.1 OprD family outer membrane porin [Commensalibacter sp. TBRC 16381]
MNKKRTCKAWVPPIIVLHSLGCTCAYCNDLDEKAKKKHGFWADSVTSIINRSVYEYRRFNGVQQIPKYTKEWGYGFMANFQSGFTTGLVGLGLDAQSYTGIRLDSSGRIGRIRLLSVSKNGRVRSVYNRTGGAAKLKISSTIFKYGIMRPKTPIFSSSDMRLLPETSTGFLITSNELKNLNVQIGRFTASADRNANSSHGDMVVNYLNPAYQNGRYFDFIGGTYKGFKSLALSTYIGRYEHNWLTCYVSANYGYTFKNTDRLILDFQGYHSKNIGKSYAGKINNTTGSILGTYQTGPHHFSLAYQKVHGDTPFDYVTRGAIWLANSTQLSDFNGPHEQSWQIKYELDISHWGIKGLVINNAFIRGTGINGTKIDKNNGYYWLGYGKNGHHWEYEFSAKYVVPKGIAKNLTIIFKQSIHKANKAQAELNTNQTRIAIEYPLIW